MRADRDDAPTRMRRESYSVYIISGLIMAGVCFSGWLAITTLVPQVIMGQLKSGFTPNPPIVSPPTQLNAKEHRISHVPPAPVEQPVRPPATHELDAQGRQIVFNDQNYRPDPQRVNIIQSVEPQVQPMAVRQRSPRARPVTQSADWIWVGANRKANSGHFTWLEVNGTIDYDTVCQNYSHGSFIYRDCRKGAKVKFAELCQQGYEATCHAANNYMP